MCHKSGVVWRPMETPLLLSAIACVYAFWHESFPYSPYGGRDGPMLSFCFFFMGLFMRRGFEGDMPDDLA